MLCSLEKSFLGNTLYEHTRTDSHYSETTIPTHRSVVYTSCTCFPDNCTKRRVHCVILHVLRQWLRSCLQRRPESSGHRTPCRREPHAWVSAVGVGMAPTEPHSHDPDDLE